MDTTSRGNAAIAASIARDSVSSARCRDCGSVLVAWVSNRAGKRYLADATSVGGGRVLPMKHLPHFKSCNGSRAELVEGSRVEVRGYTGVFEGIEDTPIGERVLVRYDHDGRLVPERPAEVRAI